MGDSTIYNMFTKASAVTWKNVLANPLILGIMAFPLDSDSTLALISIGLTLVGTSLILLKIPSISFSVSIACGIMFALGCGINGLALAIVLEHLFPDFPTVRQWEWVQWIPSAFGNLAILLWIFIVLNIAPISRPLVIGTSLVAAAAGYALMLDAVAIRATLIFGVTHKITDWEQGMVYLLNGCALIVWTRLVIPGLISVNHEKLIKASALLIGISVMLLGITKILKSVFS